MAAENIQLAEKSDESCIFSRKDPPNNLLFSCQPPPQIFDHVLIPHLQALTFNTSPSQSPSKTKPHDANNNSENLTELSDPIDPAQCSIISANSASLRHDADPFNPISPDLNPNEQNYYNSENVSYCDSGPEQFVNNPLPHYYQTPVESLQNVEYNNAPVSDAYFDQKCDDKSIVWPSPPLILNNPFYDYSLAYNGNGEPMSQVVFPDNYLSVEDACVPPYDLQMNMPENSLPFDYFYGNNTYPDIHTWNATMQPYVNSLENAPCPDQYPNEFIDNSQCVPYVPLKNIEPSYTDYPVDVDDTPYAPVTSPYMTDFYDAVGDAYSGSLSPYLEDKSQASPFLPELSYNTPRESYDVSSTASPSKKMEDLIDFMQNNTSRDGSCEASPLRPILSVDVPSSFSIDCDQSSITAQGTNQDSTYDSLDPTKSLENFSTEQTDDDSSKIITLDSDADSAPIGDKTWGWLPCSNNGQGSEPPHQIRVLDPEGNTVGIEECAPESSATRSTSASSQEEV